MQKTYVTIDEVQHGIVVAPAHSSSAPVILFTHGGPGSPILPLAYARGLDFRDHATVVFWDQRGTGMSARGVDDSSLTVDRLIADTVAVTEHTLHQLDVDQVTMLGHSWGSYLSANAVAQRPELFSAFIGVGQVNSLAAVDVARIEFFRAKAQERGDVRTVTALESFVDKDLSNDRGWGNLHEQQARLTGTGFLRKGYSRRQLLTDTLRCRPYSVRERLAVLPGMFRSHRLYQEIYDKPLTQRVPSLDVPVHLAAGAHDNVTPATQARAFYDALVAPAKRWTDFSESAHAPFIEEPERFKEWLRTALAS